MFDFLSEILSDKKGNVIFKCFGIFHIVFIAIFALLAILVCIYAKRKCNDIRKIINYFINIAFSLYVLDFFLMPFAYGEIDVEKLPFHVCTAMCVACFISRYNLFFAKFKLQFAMLGFLSNLIYLIYPAGVMWHAVHPLSYRVIQTLTFHGVMMVYGALVLVCEGDEFTWKKCYKDFIVILSMTAWAWLGNTLYNSGIRVYNWFFVMQDPFYILSQSVAPYIMPLLNITLFYAAEILVYWLFQQVTKRVKNMQ